MQFTKAEQYGVIGVLYLAQSDQNRIVPLSEISREQEIPEKFLAKIFQLLSKAGIIRSHRGIRGGFTLARDPSAITLREVLEIIQGPYHLMKCTEDRSACSRNCEELCAVREVLLIAERKLVELFEQYSLADMLIFQDQGSFPEKV